jgi:glycerate dehydrogenase
LKIVVLDGYTLNPGDLSWRRLESIGETVVYERTPEELIVERARGAQIVFTNKTPLREQTLKQLPELRYIGVLATGFDVVDTQKARERNIIVTNIPSYGTDTVAQMAIALLLELCHYVGHHSESVRSGEWSRNPDWCYWHHPIVELAGKTMGIIGFGRIGQRTARIASALGMDIIAYDETMGFAVDLPNFRFASLSEVFQTADAVSLHCPLTEATEGLIRSETLSMMKPTAFLINNSRGRLIVEADLADALNNGVIAGAALDVLSVEPPPEDHPLLHAKNCIITPHIAWASQEARQRLLNTAVDDLLAFLDGSPVHVVN